MYSFLRTPFRSISVALLVGGALLSASAQAEMVSVARDQTNFRAGPGNRHQVNWKLAKGYPLKVIKRQGSWVLAKDFEGDRGWIFRSLTSRTPHHVVRVPTANLRQEPTTRSRVRARLSYGEVLRTVDTRKGWVKVRAEDSGAVGWVAKGLLWGW